MRINRGAVRIGLMVSVCGTSEYGRVPPALVVSSLFFRAVRNARFIPEPVPAACAAAVRTADKKPYPYRSAGRVERDADDRRDPRPSAAAYPIDFRDFRALVAMVLHRGHTGIANGASAARRPPAGAAR